MSTYELVAIREAFMTCMKDCAVFERHQSGGNLFEADEIKKDGTRWLVVAAGVDQAEAADLFPGHPKRAEKACEPIRFKNICEVSILFVLHPCSVEMVTQSPLCLAVPFSQKYGVPWVQMRQGYFRIWDLPKNKHGLSDLRWEWDAVLAREPSLEKWLRGWQDDVGFNPAHPPSHVHLNTGRTDTSAKTPVRPGDRMNELRLGLGGPNPLVLILSIAAWLRTLP